MQVNFVDDNQLADLLTETRTLDMFDEPMSGNRIYVLDGGGYGDLLAFAGINGGAAIVYPCAADAESGGSIHDHARAALA